MQSETVPRTIRLKSDAVVIPETEYGNIIPVPIPYLPLFYSLPRNVNIHNTPLYSTGQVYGIDISSGIAVHALSVQPSDQVLDICTAPGNKLLYISDIIGESSIGTVTGVDVNISRLFIAKSLMRKYKCSKARLFHHDGQSFDVLAPSRIGNSPIHNQLFSNTPSAGILKPFHSTKLIRNDHQYKHEALLYDKVLVDAECTHDASLAHCIKQSKVQWTNEKELDKLEELQRGLISNGFRLLKPGGILVYSTCSYSERQNECIVLWLLEKHANARMEYVPNAHLFPLAPGLIKYSRNSVDGIHGEITGMENCLRFTPEDSGTSGLFIARIRKIA